jgi:SAM-dependent methyltransferase
MEKDRRKWNIKYGDMEPDLSPTGIVAGFAAMARTGRALDIAAGYGRNAVYIAGLGFEVDAVDISDVGLSRIGREQSRVHPIQADLDIYQIQARTYDLILNINFLQRRLFPLIIEGLKPGGLLIFETFVEGGAPTRDAPDCRDYLLRPNELLRAFLPLHILYYSEHPNEPPQKASHVASLVGRKNFL